MTTRLQQFERTIRRDPAGRGLIATEPQHGPLCEGHLASAARDLAERGGRVGIVTGFYIPHAEVPAAETDGPPGAVLLARVLNALGMKAGIITDGFCAPAVKAAADFVDLPPESVRVVEVADYQPSIINHRPFSHLIAVERVGPNHTRDSIARQSAGNGAVVSRFESAVPDERRDRCHNMQGDVIDEFTAPLHRLFEDRAALAPDGRTIGIGDGGNEIGMGTIDWHELVQRLPPGHAACVPCRIATDWTIVAGTSNWGAEALAACVALLKDRVDVLERFDCAFQERLLEHVVQHGPAVSGITGRREPVVDGLPFITYIQPWAGIRRLLGLIE
ncbi:MAG: glutamate cyclase domain-containing protein [Planctomycetaceae bacterium]